MGRGPNDLGLSRRHLAQALDASLRRLGVEHIDLYQMHAWDALTPIEETLRFLDDAMRAGKIPYYGFSNFLGWQLTKAVHVARRSAYAPPVTLQPQYNLLVRDIEHEVVPACLDAGIGLLPWSPLGGGWLSGKYAPRRAARPAPPGSARTRPAAWRPRRRATPRTRTWRAPGRGGGGGRGPRRRPGRRGARLAAGAPGGDLGDPRRPHRRAARGEPRRGRPRARRRRARDRSTRRARPRPATIPTAPPAIAQRHRKIEGGR